MIADDPRRTDAMGRVRPFEAADIPRVAKLHHRVFAPANGAALSAKAYHEYFQEVFIRNPWSASEPRSLVYEDGHGELVGFLGIMSRPMVLDGRPVRAALTSQFIVEPTQRTTLAAIKLVKAVLSGPQDLTLADEALDLTRRLWEGLGGKTARLFSLYWARVLRPTELAVTRWGTGAARAWTALCRVADAAVARLPGNPLRAPAPGALGEELTGDMLAACIDELASNRALRPEYDGRAATWLLETLANKPGSGTLRKVLVRAAAGEIAGWYVYCGHRGGLAEVLQLGARESSIGEVLDHLFAQAWRDGATALVGRIDPQFVGAMSARHCFFHHRGYWTLVHSKDPALIHAIQQGDAFLSRLEGEWCMRFRIGYA